MEGFYTIKQKLYMITTDTTHENGLEKIATDCFNDLVNRMQQMASYGLLKHNFPLNFVYIPKGCDDRVMYYFKKKLELAGFKPEDYQITGQEQIEICWKPPSHDVRIPRVTARDLIQAGYDPANQALFGRILKGLREALMNGQVSSESVNAQIFWVKTQFSEGTK